MVGSSNPSIGHLFWCICGFSRLLIRLDGHPAQVFTSSFGDLDTSWSALQLNFDGLVTIVATITGVVLMVTLAAALSQSKWVWFFKSSRTPVHTTKLKDSTFLTKLAEASGVA